MKTVLAIGLFLATSAGLALSVPAQKMDYYVYPGTDFSSFRTYSWGRAEKAVYPADDLDQMFIRTIDAELAKKGLARTESETSDLIVTYQIAIVADMEWSSAKSTVPWLGVVGMNSGVGGAVVGGTNTIQKGAFILDLYHPASRRRIWQVNAVKTLADTTDLNKREANTKKVMAKIFKNYPPKAK